MKVTVEDVAQAGRYEAHVAGTGQLAGFARYERGEGQITFVHTEVFPAFEGHGVGSALARTSLEEARMEGLQVLPLCSFYRGYLERHPEYAELAEGDPA
ncbi:GNAT family N-acetyltransferase [Phaeacidiphilus oryzae]|uniref:GNAT family N-acetyltransferase n=1 Tax=Phaeacidiphilus oryzae TaxID=348818 RepID=UPI000559DDD8|nr:GNAT family N-acetyltransferase [Phaeacidiphilus oryzae]